MKMQCLTIGILLAACSSAPTSLDDGSETAQEETKEWSELNKAVYTSKGVLQSEDGGFVVDLPGEPEYSTDLVQTEVGKVKAHSYIFSESATEAFMIYYADYPSEYVESVDNKEMLHRAMIGALRPLEVDGAKESKYFTVNGQPALEFRTDDGRKKMHMAGRLYLVKNRLYQVIIFRDGSYPSQETEERFFGSFHLID